MELVFLSEDAQIYPLFLIEVSIAASIYHAQSANAVLHSANDENVVGSLEQEKGDTLTDEDIDVEQVVEQEAEHKHDYFDNDILNKDNQEHRPDLPAYRQPPSSVQEQPIDESLDHLPLDATNDDMEHPDITVPHYIDDPPHNQNMVGRKRDMFRKMDVEQEQDQKQSYFDHYVSAPPMEKPSIDAFESHREEKKQDDDVVPPHGWMTCNTELGEKYYVNVITNDVAFERPEAMNLDLSQMDNGDEQLLQNDHEIRHYQTWQCQQCTFADNPTTHELCGACEAAIPGKIKCEACTAVHPEGTKRCLVCGSAMANDYELMDNIYDPSAYFPDPQPAHNEKQEQLMNDQEMAMLLQQDETIPIDMGFGAPQTNFSKDQQLELEMQEREAAKLVLDGPWEVRNSDEEKEHEEEHKPMQNLRLPPIRYKQPVHGAPQDIMTLYHCTDAESARKIKESNKMIRGKEGMFGGGIYFAETKFDANYKAEHKGMMITCKVYVGKCLRVEDAEGGKFTFTSLYNEGYDSVWAPNGSGKGNCERVVYNWDQVVIESIEEY